MVVLVFFDLGNISMSDELTGLPLMDDEQPAVPLEQLTEQVTELNGPKGPEPTRFGDWERKGRCIDF